MIKKLFYIAALLLPGLAYAGDPSADLPVQVVPSGGGIACDVGPNAPPVPAPAQAAGFTHCALNMDFTTSAVDGNGVNWQNPNTWLAECNGSLPVNNTYFRLTFNDSTHGQVPRAPCNRAFIINDNGTTVFDLRLLASDYTNNSYDTIAFEWPTTSWGGNGISGQCCLPGGGPLGNGMFTPKMIEFTIRVPSSTFANLTPGSDSGLLDFWQDQCNACGLGYNTDGSAPEPEIDYFETHASTFTGSTIQVNSFQTCPGGSFSSACASLDILNYHTYGLLDTSDGVNGRGGCFYIDGAKSNCSTDVSDFTRWTNGKLISMWNTAANCYGGVKGSCLTSGSADIYIKSVRVWTCSNYWNANCFGPIISSDAGQKTRFGWLSGAWQTLIGWLSIPPANAQETDLLDGHIGRWWITAMPPEFRGVEWWNACLPNHPDCVWSATAFLGQNSDGMVALGKHWANYAKRGPGYCYTSQPYTCSPSGQVRQ